MPRIAPSRGTHLLLDQADLPMGKAACIVPAGEGRMIFSLPWYGRTLIGTTDNDFEGDISHPRPAEDDVGYLLEAVNEFFGTSLTESDLVGAYAGVRPLISSGDPRKSVDISRKAELYETSSGMLTITGGKLTTWRRMAKQTVDRLVEREGREAPCHTAEIPLGMDGARRRTWRRRRGSARRRVAQLAFRYGHAARKVLALAREDPQAGGADRPRPSRPAGRGRDRRPPRAGPQRRRRAAAPDPAGAAGGAAAARRRRGPSSRRGPGGRAGLVAAPGQAGGRGLAGGRRRRGHRPRRARPVG